MSASLIEVKHLKKEYPVRRNFSSGKNLIIRAADNISFRIQSGETAALVGESGCGKTTVARLVALLEKPAGGVIRFNGEPADRMKGKMLKGFREKVQFIFTDAASSLHPQKTVYRIIAAGMQNFHYYKDRKLMKQKVTEILNRVGLSGDYLNCLPHELSVCSRQQVSVARALAVHPSLLICDDPAALPDPSDSTQIINLLAGLKQGLNLSLFFITRDIGQARIIADHVMIMYRGKIVEAAPVKSLFENTAHPYTKALISAGINPVSKTSMSRIILKGEMTQAAVRATDSITGCCFADRCYMVQDICVRETPLARQLIQGHTAYCHFAERV